MANPLLEKLQAGSGGDLFVPNATTLSYKTGYPHLDLALAYEVPVYKNDILVDRYINMGIPAGCMVTIIGKPGTSKTTWATKVASNIVRDFESGTVIHFDIEQAWNYTRVAELSNMPMSTIEEKYILRQERSTINDIFKSIKKIYKEKMADKVFDYDTGRLNEFGEPIIIKQPTVVLIDSIASLVTDIDDSSTAKKNVEKSENVSGQTDKMRLAGEIGRFFTEVNPYLREANIIIIAINQLRNKADMGFIPTPAELLYLNQDETAPGGKAPQFLAHILLKVENIGSGKTTIEEHGYHGNVLRMKIIKSRVSKSGVVIPFFYDTCNGVDPLRSMMLVASDLGLTGGNKSKTYFINNKEESFPLANIHDEFDSRPELYKIMYDTVLPVLKEEIRSVDTFRKFNATAMNY